MTLTTLVDRHARYRRDHDALVVGEERWTWSQLRDRVDSLLHGLAAVGVGPGDHVALLLDNCVPLVELYLAAAKSGIVVVPLSPLLRGRGLVTLVNDADADALVAMDHLTDHLAAVGDDLDVPRERRFVVGDAVDGWQHYDELTAQAPPAVLTPAVVEDSSTFNLMYSSGTTGTPKGIVHTHAVREAYCTGFAMSFRVTPDSVVVHSGSLVFNGAMLTVMPWLYTGATFVLLPGFEVEAVLDAIAREGGTHAMLVPSQITQLLEEERFTLDALPRMRMVGSVGAPLLLEAKKELLARFPDRCYELYGLTEGFVTVLDADDFVRKSASVGVPPPLYEMRILDDDGAEVPHGEVGEICGRGPITMPHYYQQPELTAAAFSDGWLRSGDLGRVDEEGFLHLVDRKKDLIISGGVNVYPTDVEEVVIGHPHVREVSVFGVDHPRWGEQPVAAVRATDGADAAEIREWVNERVDARYQKLGDVVVVEDFPRSVAGKTLRRELAADYEAGRTATTDDA